MPHFRYKARGGKGELIEGVVEAANADTVATQLVKTGVAPVEISLSGTGASAAATVPAFFQGQRVTIDDLIMFCRQLYSLVKAGVPIMRGLRGLIESSRNRLMQSALEDVAANLESGHDLASSLGRHPDIFSPIVVATVRVGENSGRLEDALFRVSGYLEAEKDTRERIRAALRYPAFVIIAIAVAITIINIWVIPAFAQVFAKANVDLPWATLLLITTSDFAVAYWHLILGGIVGSAAGINAYINTERGRFRWDRFKLRIPIVGSILHRATLSHFARGFALSLRSGVPLIQGLSVVAKAVDNDYLAENILLMRRGIERGDTLTRTAAATGLFTPLVLQMLAVGEETGQVDDDVAELRNRRRLGVRLERHDDLPVG